MPEQLDFQSMDNVQYDDTLNNIARDLFGIKDEELDKERVRLMQWALINLLINKGVFSQEEFTDSVGEATTFFKLLKRRYSLQNPDNTDDSNENA